MASCICRPYKRPYGDVGDDRFKTAFTRAHYYENVVDHPLIHLHVTRNARKDLKVTDPIMLDLNKSVYNKTYDVKFWDNCKSSDSYKRTSIVSQPTLKIMHEKYMKDPVMPMKVGLTSTGLAYGPPKQIRPPLRLSQKSPVEDATCPIRAFGRDEFPPIPPNEVGYHKHLDPLVGTSQMTHIRFTVNQQNGVARKDNITFYDATGVPKVRGFGPKKLVSIGAYFHHDKTAPDLVRPKQLCRVPYYGKTSEYKGKFDHVPTNLMYWAPDPEIRFAPVHKPSAFDILATPGFYCTEYCHTGTGWPPRTVVDIGKTKGTF